jgi:hypothetical protein
MFHSDEDSRTIGLLGLVMLLLIVLGYVMLGITMKVNGFPDNSMFRWSSMAVTLRAHGQWFLLMPVFWVLYAVTTSRINRGFFAEAVTLVIGFLFTLATAAIFGLFLYATMNSHSRPLLIAIPPQNTQETLGK